MIRMTVVAIVVVVMFAAITFAVIQGKSAVTAPAAIRMTVVTAKYVAVRAKNVVRIQVLIAVNLMKNAVMAPAVSLSAATTGIANIASAEAVNHALKKPATTKN